ncbi:MAG TPA: NAD-dependent dihydroorotate dehydrogenase B electron transfer subunit [Firmicutes bacterium]|nr:NAD-dependent dihydroorotate dehydrogenase B electron transfer subunit [Bacillota bacterium]
MLVQKNRQLMGDVFALELTGEFCYEEVMPGQFVHVLIGDGMGHPLRRPLSIACCDPAKRSLTLVYRVVGDGTKWLSTRHKGEAIDVLGPLGRGFPAPEMPGQVLIVGGGVGIPPLYQLARELAAQNVLTDIVLGFKTKGEAFWAEEFGAYGQVTVCTEDGSLGEKGVVTTVLGTDRDWSTVYSCGPKPMLQALKSHFQGRDIKGYVSLEERMACGVGACWGCTCQSADSSWVRRICKEGPVFPWEEIRL